MDKSIDAKEYGIVKTKVVSLKGHYESLFAPLAGQSINLLKFGVFKRASLCFWRDYFEKATIMGLNSNPPLRVDDPNVRIYIYRGYQLVTELRVSIVQEQTPDNSDVVIDDCSHIGRFARISFWHLFQNHLKPGGLYAIVEDWGTGYVRSQPDRRHYKPASHLRQPRHKQALDLLSESSSNIISRAFSTLFVISQNGTLWRHNMVDTSGLAPAK